MRRYIYLLFTTSILAACSGSKTSDSNVITDSDEFSGKTFSTAVSTPANDDLKDVEVTTIFNKDTTGEYRMKKGAMLIVKPFGWRFERDSLRVKVIPEIPKDNTIPPQAYQTRPLYYAVTKEASGYMLRGKQDQLLLTVLN